MKKPDERIKRKFDHEVSITMAIQKKGEELRKSRNGTARYGDALISLGLNQCRTKTTRRYAFGLEMNRPEHYQRFLEDEAIMLEYAKKLEVGDEVPDNVCALKNVIYGAFKPYSQKNDKISSFIRARLEMGMVSPSMGLRRVK